MAIFNSNVSLPEGINHNQSSFFCFQFILQGIGEQVAFDFIFHFLLPGLRSPPPSSLHWTSLHQLLPLRLLEACNSWSSRRSHTTPGASMTSSDIDCKNEDPGAPKVHHLNLQVPFSLQAVVFLLYFSSQSLQYL